MLNIILKIFLVLILLENSGCGPKIFSFNADPQWATKADSVHLHWKIRGNPNVSFYQKTIRLTGGDSTPVLEFILVASKSGKTSAPGIVQIELVHDTSRDLLAVPITRRSGDTLFASDIKDTVLFRGFLIVSSSSVSNRKVVAKHDGAEGVFTSAGLPVSAFNGLHYSGNWEIYSMMTEEEKKNNSLIPDRFELEFTIHQKK